MVYAVWLTGLGILFWVLEGVWPRNAQQAFFRRGLVSDLVYVAFNSHALGMIMAALTAGLIARWDELLTAGGVRPLFYLGLMGAQPFWIQFAVLLAVFDFLQWCIHNLLHRVNWLWEFHKVHHSIVDMDWVGDWRFHWGEILVYRGLLYVPAAFFGFRGDVMFWVGVANTLAGHFAHANLNWRIGPLRYFVNSPEMHIWHHNHPEEGPVNRNFGITLSVWDWMLGTAYLPDHDPKRLGFEGIEAYPKQLPGQWVAPFARLAGR
jgi:sterol desaturase/sphingolipid hydroxylase (fatty acid hydroxylase superfamily)